MVRSGSAWATHVARGFGFQCTNSNVPRNLPCVNPIKSSGTRSISDEFSSQLPVGRGFMRNASLPSSFYPPRQFTINELFRVMLISLQNSRGTGSRLALMVISVMSGDDSAKRLIPRFLALHIAKRSGSKPQHMYALGALQYFSRLVCLVANLHCSPYDLRCRPLFSLYDVTELHHYLSLAVLSLGSFTMHAVERVDR